MLVLLELDTLATLGPAMSELHRRAKSFLGGRKFRAFIKGHDNIRSESTLDLHGFFRRDEMLGSVDVRLERDSIFSELINIGERKNLIAAGIGENRTRPAHPFMESTHLLHELMTRPK